MSAQTVILSAVAYIRLQIGMKFILGTKKNMTQIFDDAGRVHPATVVETGPMTVIKVKTKETDGYFAVQVGFGEKKEKNTNKAQKGQFKDLKNFRYVREYRIMPSEAEALKTGDIISPSIFSEGEKVTISSTSKGKGFQGVVKRHGFKGGPRSHGQKHSEREPGSIGSAGIQRVFKGVRMAGRMGGDKVTQKNLTLVQIDKDGAHILIRGAVAGRPGTLVEIKA